MPATYEPIATQTLGSATNSITFSSIPTTYTDLRLVLNVLGTNLGGIGVYLRFNSNTSAIYSYTSLAGDGASASSGNNTDTSYLYLTNNLPNATPQLCTADIFSYTGSTNKTSLIEMNADNNGSGSVKRYVGLWRNTSAINAINIVSDTSGNTLGIGTTATLYGIKAA